MLQYALLTKTGGRPVNEDTVAARNHGDAWLFALADGLGGHGGGEVASQLAVQAAGQVFEESALPFEERLAAAMDKGQADILAQQAQTGRMNDLKTTMVLLQTEGGRAQWAHVGDSRLYWFIGGKLAGRTLDHSVPQMLVSTGEIRERDIRYHEDRNRLTRVMGMEWESPKYTLGEEISAKQGTAFLLCTDGFWELVDEKQMAKALKHSQSPKAWLDAMEAVVQKNGAGKKMDNYSAIAVWM